MMAPRLPHLSAAVALCSVLALAPSAWAQQAAPRDTPAPSSDPHGVSRIMGGVGLLAGSVLVAAPVAVYLGAEVPQGAAPAAAVGLVSLVALVAGILEITTGVREVRADRSAPALTLGPAGLTVTF
jgi:peptidoglycan/LPS O-acetylase OafA/YrhL